MKKKVYFLYDFLLPAGPLQFGYTKYELPINVLNQVDNNLNENGVLMSSPSQPAVYTLNTGMFADEFINHNENWTKTTVNEVEGIMEKKSYNEEDNLFLVVLESTNASSFFDYYLDPTLKFKDLFSPRLLKYLKKYKNIKILMMDNREGSYNHKERLLSKIQDFLEEVGIEHKNKFIISTCNEHINKLKSFKSYPKQQIKVYNNDFYVYKSGQFIVETEERENEIVENGYSYSLQTKLNFEDKEKYYLMYNRNSARLHRPYFINKLFKNNILDKGIVSLFKTPDFDNILKNKNHTDTLGIGEEDYLEWEETIDNWYPLVIDNDNEEEVAWYHNFLSRKDEYEKTYFSIVSETSADSKYLFVTEKTLKPIMNLHPFFINGNPGILNHLKLIGFKTFDKWWDESYDSETNFKKRTDMIIEQVKLVCNKSPKEMNTMILEMKNILTYNKSLLRQLFTSKEYEKKLVKELTTETPLI